MGFDWNRHNQKNYTNDNLPPKTDRGYKFNIFYQYLIDKTKKKYEGKKLTTHDERKYILNRRQR